MAATPRDQRTARTAAALWSLERGARVVDAGVHFAVWAPRAGQVSVRLLSGRARGDHLLNRDEHGLFEGEVQGAAAGDDYQYVLASAGAAPLALPDPVSRHQPQGVHGPSRVVDPHAFAWTDSGWRGLDMAGFIIYELHVGTFSDEGTFDGVIPHLRALRELGVTAIEIMPVAEFPGSRNWGYDGVYLYAPQSSYGGPDAFRRLVNAAHETGLAVVLDVVYNHLGPEGNRLGDYGPYFTDTYHTPWGQAVNYDGAGSDDVRRFVIDNALYWVHEFHIDALRLDAVHGIFDFGARHILEELSTAVHEHAARLGRRVQVIAESDLNDPKLLRGAERGGYGMDAQWTDDFHHAVHVALTGERSGYYVAYDGVPSLARQLERRFTHDGTWSSFRDRRHGAPATDLAADRFVVFVQNHDQIGNRAAGERLSSLVSFEQLKLAAAVLLLSPYVPLLFMGEEYGETNPFLYFVSHSDPALVEAVRSGRRREFESFGWGADVPDPQSEDTFRRSRLDRSRAHEPRHAALLTLYRDLLQLRRTEPALVPGRARVQVDHDAGGGWLTLELSPHASPERALFAAFNFSGAKLEAPVPRATGSWRPMLWTDAVRYGGRAEAPRTPLDVAGEREDQRLIVAAHGAVLYRLENT